MEQLEIHSKSYLVRWVRMKAEHTISWSIRPDRKSLNFGIFKHPGSDDGPTPRLPSSTFEPPPTPALRPEDLPQESNPTRNASSTATEKLKSIGLRPISWYGICEANRVATGKYDVSQGEGGMYALVFDNTFAKQFSKTATFVLLTYPTASPPQSSHHMHHIDGYSSENTSTQKEILSQRKKATRQTSTDSIQKFDLSSPDGHVDPDAPRNKGRGETDEAAVSSNLFNGNLQKRRRRRHQGWARRFFSLDYKTSTLSYYHDRNTLSLRGAVPLSLAAIGANAKTRQISVDSGAEIWHLKAANSRDFNAWKHALELARSSNEPSISDTGPGRDALRSKISPASANPDEAREWARVESLVDKVKAVRDATRTIAKDTDPKYLPSDPVKPRSEIWESNPTSGTSSNSDSPPEQGLNGYFNDSTGDRRPFWKRKPSGDRPSPVIFKRSVSANPSVTSLKSAPPTPNKMKSLHNDSQPLQSHVEEGLHDHCMSLLQDLDAVVTDFGLLIAESNQRRAPARTSAIPRPSMDSTNSDVFFDAEGFSSSQLLAIHHESDEDLDHDDINEGDSGSSSEVEEPEAVKLKSVQGETAPGFPQKQDSLSPLPAQHVNRRTTVSIPTVSPPNLVGLLRRNMGKDLSTISMPVSTNEPISLLQRVSESLEYSSLLNTAAAAKSSVDRLLHISAFAISIISSARVKERAIRKPFTPMLGETFELVREDRGFRFLAEKVSHRPLRMACQADSDLWSLTQSPMPSQRFFGKSAQLDTEGKFRVVLHSTDDHFSWSPSTSFLRNILAGEKYVEPVGTLVISNETTGEKAVAKFKAGSMFSGRSEDVSVQVFDGSGDEQDLGLIGTWTKSLAITENGKSKGEAPIWEVLELVPDAAKRYGFTTFASSLNEITSLEKGKLPLTDSRLRPDQRAVEHGDLDAAEDLKSRLEEAQRKRRKAWEDQCREWKPKWFELAEGESKGQEEVWVAKSGKENYWEERKEGKWERVEKVFEV